MADLTRWKAEAKEAGIPWSHVQDCYRDLRKAETERREREDQLRKEAHNRITPPGCHEFWRHGLQLKWKRLIQQGGDFDQIRGFDKLVSGMIYQFPELALQDDPAQALFEFLTAPRAPMPSADDTYKQAIDLLWMQRNMAPSEELEDVPF